MGPISKVLDYTRLERYYDNTVQCVDRRINTAPTILLMILLIMTTLVSLNTGEMTLFIMTLLITDFTI
jgi:hypothetical protein